MQCANTLGPCHVDKQWCRVIVGLRKVAKYGPSDHLRFPKTIAFPHLLELLKLPFLA